MFTVMLAFAFGVYFGHADAAARDPEGWRLAFQLGAVSLVVLGMPAIVLAWRLPDEPHFHE